MTTGRINSVENTEIVGGIADTPPSASTSFSDWRPPSYISAMSSNHMPNVSLAECAHIGIRSATSAVRLSSHTGEFD